MSLKKEGLFREMQKLGMNCSLTLVEIPSIANSKHSNIMNQAPKDHEIGLKIINVGFFYFPSDFQVFFWTHMGARKLLLNES